MEITLQGNSQAKRQVPHAKLVEGMGWGLVGGLAGTLVMDAILMSALLLVGLPALTCFMIVGDTAGRFFSLFGVQTAGGPPLGVATHYLVGPLVGVIFSAALLRVNALRVESLKKVILLAVIYVEVLAQPILATTPILLKMTAAETLQWFGISFVMHFIFAVVLGSVLNYGLGRAALQR